MRRLRSIVAATLLAGAAVLAVVLSADAASAATATFTKDSDWGTGYQARFTVTNNASSTITSWRVEFDLPPGTTMGSYWEALLTSTGNHHTFVNRSYNGTLAPGASTVFGFLVAGAGTPTNCTVDGASCGGGAPPTTTPPTTTPPSATPSTRPTATPTSSPPPAGALPFAPYVDMGAWPSPLLSDLRADGGIPGFTLAFITASQCKAMWFNAFDPRDGWMLDEVDAVRAAGGDVKISFGGASGIELAQACTTVDSLVAEYQAVVSAYQLRYIDLDIEGAATADPVSVNRRSQALARLQQANPGLRVSLTLPVLPEGLTADGLGVVRSARDAGVDVDIVNVMAMDYYRDGDYGAFAVQAAQSTFDQLRTLYPGRSDAQLWRMVGVTPMLGQNDDRRVFDQADARQLVQFAQQHHLGVLAYWEVTRDRNACTGALYRCTNIPQSPYEFSRIFAGYSG